MKRTDPTPARVRELYEYESGHLIRNGRKSASGTGNEYAYLSVDGQQYGAHRLIWIWHNGQIPEDMGVDHIDGDIHNNKIENLQTITRRENTLKGRRHGKRKLPANVYAGKPGFVVSFSRSRNGKRFCEYVGSFATVEEAVVARDQHLSRVY